MNKRDVLDFRMGVATGERRLCIVPFNFDYDISTLTKVFTVLVFCCLEVGCATGQRSNADAANLSSYVAIVEMKRSDFVGEWIAVDSAMHWTYLITLEDNGAGTIKIAGEDYEAVKVAIANWRLDLDNFKIVLSGKYDDKPYEIQGDVLPGEITRLNASSLPVGNIGEFRFIQFERFIERLDRLRRWNS